MSELQEGRLLAGGYRVGRQIGQGGMGNVYEAVQEPLGRPVALKQLNARFASDHTQAARFRQEAEVTASLDHPHILSVTDFHVGAEPSAPTFIVMERLAGQSLLTAVRAGRLSPERAVRIALGVLSALEAAHAANIVHRDIKPSNVFLTQLADGGELAKVLDFGIAHFGGRVSGRLTEAGAVLGTVRYAAPEQLLGHPVDARTDVFAVGGLLYAMLAGRPAFDGAPDELIGQVCETDPPSLGVVVPSCDPRVIAVVTRAMRRSPLERFGSAREMAERLRGCLRASTDLNAGPANPPAALEQTAPAATEPARLLVEGTRVEHASPRARRSTASRARPVWIAGAVLIAGLAGALGAAAVVVGLGMAGDEPESAAGTVRPDAPRADTGASAQGAPQARERPSSEPGQVPEVVPGAVDAPADLVPGSRVVGIYRGGLLAGSWYVAELIEVTGAGVTIRWLSDGVVATIPETDVVHVYRPPPTVNPSVGTRIAYMGPGRLLSNTRVVGTVQGLDAAAIRVRRTDGTLATIGLEDILGPATVGRDEVAVGSHVETLYGDYLWPARVVRVGTDTVRVHWLEGGYPDGDIPLADLVTLVSRPIP